MPAASHSVSTSVDIKVYTKNSSITHVHIPVTLPICIKKTMLSVKREERKPTRCNNIDDLLSIVDVDY